MGYYVSENVCFVFWLQIIESFVGKWEKNLPGSRFKL